MDYLGKAKEQVTGLATRIAGHRSSGGRAQTVTINRSREEIDRFWRDPEKLSQVLDPRARVRSPEGDVFEWMLSAGPGGTQTWRTRLLASGDGLRFVADPADTGGTGGRAEVVVSRTWTMTSWGLRIRGSSTVSTARSLTPFQHSARMTISYR